MDADKKAFRREAARIQTKYERMDCVFSFFSPVFLTIGVALLTVYFAMGMEDIWLTGFSAVFFALWLLCIIVSRVSIPGMYANEMADLTLRFALKGRNDPRKDDL